MQFFSGSAHDIEFSPLDERLQLYAKMRATEKHADKQCFMQEFLKLPCIVFGKCFLPYDLAAAFPTKNDT